MDINVLIKLDESKRELIELIPTSPKRIYNIQLPHITEYSKIIDNMYVKIIYMNKYKSDQLVFSYNYIEHINATKYWKTKQELVRIFIPRFDIQDSDGKQTEKVFNILVYIIYLLLSSYHISSVEKDILMSFFEKKNINSESLYLKNNLTIDELVNSINKIIVTYSEENEYISNYNDIPEFKLLKK